MKTATAIILLSFCISASSVIAQEKSKGLVLLNSSGNSITLSSPAAVTNNSILFPGTLGLQGALMYISSVAGSVGTTTWLNPGTNGFVLTLAGGVPTWANIASVDWQLIGNGGTTPGVGAGQNYLGTSDAKDLVLATSATERMRVLSTGNIAINSATAPQLFTIGGDIGIVGTGSKVTASGTANELIMEETSDTYGTSRLRMQDRNGSNGALFEQIENAGNPGVDLVDFGFKPGTKVQSNIRLEARTGTLRGTPNITSATATEFQFLFGSTTVPQYVLSIGQGATLLEAGNFGIGYSAGSGTFPVASPLEKLDVHTGNIILSNTGTSSVTGTAGILKFQGTKDGITSFAAGGQGSNTYNYTWPAATPSAGQVLTINTISGATPFAVALSWATPATAPTSFADNVFSIFNSVTNTKIAAFSAASISAATTRTFTFPDVNGTLITTGNLASITTTGTITTGVWNGTAIGPTFGGTGQTTYTLGDMLYANGANSLTKLAGNTSSVKQFLTQTGTGAISAQPLWGAIVYTDLPTIASNTILGNNTGGAATPIALTAAQVKTVLSLNNVENTALSTWPGTTNVITLGTITTGTWNGTAIGPTFGGTGQTTYTLGDILYSSAANTLSKLPGNTTATKKFLTQTGTGAVSAAPGWNTIAATDVPIFIASGATHAVGVVPDPGAAAGTTRFLREDATWAVPTASTDWLLGGNSLPPSNIFGTTSATNVLLEANSTQTIQLTGVATANYDVGSALFGTTATPIVSTGDKIVINGGNFSLNSETNGAITREIVFRGTAGSGNLRIRGDGNDLYWQGGGGKNLQMGAFWQINLLGQLQTASLQALSSSTSFAHVYIPLQQAGDPGLVIQNASGQTSDPFQIQAFNATQGSGTILTRVTSAGYVGIGSTTPTAPLHISQAITASSGNATGAIVNQTLTAAANNDILYGVNITPTFTNGAFTGLTNYSLRAVDAGTLINSAGIRGEATGNGGASTEVIGVWGIATNATQASNTDAGVGVRAEGNATTTDANSNIAFQVINGEFVVARQAAKAANDNTAGNNIIVANEDDASGLNDQGPSGVVDVTDGGLPANRATTTGFLTVFNRYAKAHSIILVTPMDGGTGILDAANGEVMTFRVSNRANGSFRIEVNRNEIPNAASAGTAGTWRFGFLIVNPGK